MSLSPLQIQKPVEQPPLGGHMVALDLGAWPGDGSVAHLTLCGHQLEVTLQYCVRGPLHYHMSARSGHSTREAMGNNICSPGGLLTIHNSPGWEVTSILTWTKFNSTLLFNKHILRYSE